MLCIRKNKFISQSKYIFCIQLTDLKIKQLTLTKSS